MTDLAVHSENWDLAIVDGDLVLVDGAASVAQSTSITLKLNQGEWFLDQRQGLERDRVFGKNISTVLRDAEYRRAILSVDGVIEVLDLQVEFDPVTRTATPKFKARTVFDGVEPIEIGGDYDPLAFPPIDGCPLPEDGVYSGGVWQGPEAQGYQSWGWSRDLDEMPEFQSVDRVGITHAQILAGLNVTPQGFLRWSWRASVNAGASINHTFRITPPQQTWQSDGVQFAMNFWRGEATNQRNQTVFCGMDAFDEHGDPAIIPGTTSNRFYNGYESTNSAANQIRQHLGPVTSQSSGAGNGGFGLIIKPQNKQMNIMKSAIGIFKRTNTAGNTDIIDPRPDGATLDGVFWRPYIEITMSGDRSVAYDFEMFFYDFMVSGIPKT